MAYAIPMQNNEDQILPSKTSWVIYIVRCRDGSYYTGITTDLTRRIDEHNSPGGGAKYTRPRQPVTLVYSQPAPSRAAAAQRESQIKKMRVAGKNRLIASNSAAPDSMGGKLSRQTDLPEKPPS